jgi:vacuolar protein sorting-associated protein IST1
LDEGLEEPIASIIWAAPRLQGEVQELKVISDEFTKKYSKEFADSCRTNSLNNVNEKLMHKLAVQAPPKILIEKYLEEIAKTYNVPFEPDPGVIQADETLQAEGMLIDFNDRRNNAGGGGGGGGGGIGVPAGAVPGAGPPPIGFPQPQAVSFKGHVKQLCRYSNYNLHNGQCENSFM